MEARTLHTHDDDPTRGFVNDAFKMDADGAGSREHPRVDGDNRIPDASQEVTPLNGARPTTLWVKVRSKLWAIPLIYTQFWFSGISSLSAPFFPGLATSRGLTAWQYSFFFSTFKIGMLFGSITAERLAAYLSPRAGYLAGQSGFFIYTVVFGSFYWVQDGSTLLGLSVTSALFGGAVASMYTVSLYAMITARFKDNAGLLIASMECLWGIGTMVGSVIGGALIDLWAYPLPFYIMGGLLLLSIPAMAKMNPKREDTAVQSEQPTAESADVKYYRLLWDLPFLADMVTVMLSWAILSFNEPTLEPFLVKQFEHFKVSSTQVGTIFTVQSVGYSACALVAGVLSKYKYERLTIFVATVIACLAYVIVGPAPFIPLEPNLGLIYFSQICMGLGMSCQFICGYMHSLRSVIDRGYPDNDRTSSIVSSAAFFCMIIGAVTTSPLAGYLADHFGYRKATLFMFVTLLLWSVVTFVMWVRGLWSTRRWHSLGS